MSTVATLPYRLSQTRLFLEIRRVIPACRVPALRGAVNRLDALGGAWAPALVQPQASDVFYYPLDQLVVGLCPSLVRLT